MAFDRLVLITRQTELEALIERFQTRSQAEFYLTQAGQDFQQIATRDDIYQAALSKIRSAIPNDLKIHVIERRTLSQYRFEAKDVVVTLGQDGLVANVAKYLDGQPLLAVNPDPGSIDGVLLPVSVTAFQTVLKRVLTEAADTKSVTMAEARLSDGQIIRAVNDIFIGSASHASARYHVQIGNQSEEHSSSGLIVSTGVGSTGWLRSIYAGAIAISRQLNPELAIPQPEPLPWDAEKLVFNVREPWPSLTTQAMLVSGQLLGGQVLMLTSRMPTGGVIFGDGVQADYLDFNAGVVAQLGVADRRLCLVLS